MLPSSAKKMEPVRSAGYNTDLRNSSRKLQTPREGKKRISSPQSSHSLRLKDQYKSDKPISQSYGYLHHEVKQNISSGPLLTPKSSQNYQKQSFEKKVSKDDELVKHMSNLPCYLQRVERENVQEKVLNFGVLDWERLEKWKYYQKQGSSRFSISSPSNSNTSSPFSTVGSSNVSTESDSGIATRGKQSPAQHPRVTGSSGGRYSKGMKPPRGDTSLHYDLKTVPKFALVQQQKQHETNLSEEKSLEIKFEKEKKKVSDSKFYLEMATPSPSSKAGVLFGPKGKTGDPEGVPPCRTGKFQELIPDQYSKDRENKIVLLLPGNSSTKITSSISQHAGRGTKKNGIQKEANRRSFSDGFVVNEEVHFSKLYSDIPHSWSQPSGIETSAHLDISLASSVSAESLKAPSDVSHFSPRSSEMASFPSKDKLTEEKNVDAKLTNRMLAKPCNGSGLEFAELPASRRSQSPNCRSSSAFTKISRSFSSKRGSAQFSEPCVTVNSDSLISDACSDNSSRDKTTANGKARSSPLRRLLNPLLKSKSVNHVNSSDPPQDESTSMRDVCNSIDGSVDFSVQSAKRVLSFSTARPTDIPNAQQDEMHKVPIVQALMQVSVRNGLPWFTFAVDNSKDILAATMRKVSAAGKYDCSWIYTFYSFLKTKKKGGWISQGRSKNHDYVPGVVGHMKVSGSRFSKLSRQDCNDQVMVREFILFGVEPQQIHQEALDSQPNSELAAIVIKVRKETKGRSISSDEHCGNNQNNTPRMGLPEFSSEKKLLKSGAAVGSQNLTDTVVILPSGVHGLPLTGQPSPLIDRWRSGGSCDCGGWDIGCQQRVLSNHDKRRGDLCSAKVCRTQDQFDLFVQGRGQEKCPSFSMVSYSKEVHSIDFSGSISTLQAFSISIAFLHSKNLAKVSNLFAELKQEPMSMDTEHVKVCTQVVAKAPSSAATPPRSPVGRV